MTCRICLAEKEEPLLDFGMQPVCNRFPASAAEVVPHIPLALKQCRNCGLLQLDEAPAIDQICPDVDWVIYNEAESHLDDTVERIVSYSSISSDTRVLGISYKDETTVARIAAKGVRHTHTLDMQADLEIANPCAGLESLQAQLTPERADTICQKYGPADILIVRHILEHTHHPRQFVRALTRLLKPDGLMLFEVPDFSASLRAYDYAYLWEEHIAYYTPATFRRSFSQLGLQPESFFHYNYPLETALLGIARPSNDALPEQPDPNPSELSDAISFRDNFIKTKKAIQHYLKKRTNSGKKTAIFGAGHIACKFVNFYEIKDYISFVADDHPHKKGRFMPGSGIPILGSDALLTQQPELCLLALSPESEAKVRLAQNKYLSAGGTFSTIFPAMDNFFLTCRSTT